MRTYAIICIIIILLILTACQPSRNDEAIKQLNGRWKFLGNWKGPYLQQDTLKVGFCEVPFLDSTTNKPIHIISEDTFSYDIVTDSGIWKITTVENKEVIDAQPNPYIASVLIDKNAGWYMIDNYTDTLKVTLTDNQIKIYRRAVIDEYTRDTLINESSGTIELMAANSMHIIWDTGVTSKHEKVGSTH